jgi:hypothetical protein
VARVAHAKLNHNRSRAFVYLFEDIGWCGSAGCALLIGEAHNNGLCHILYDGYGWYSFTVLNTRDYGYRRLYLPCEARFDGRRYQQLNPDCPSAKIEH